MQFVYFVPLRVHFVDSLENGHHHKDYPVHVTWLIFKEVIFCILGNGVGIIVILSHNLRRWKDGPKHQCLYDFYRIVLWDKQLVMETNEVLGHNEKRDEQCQAVAVFSVQILVSGVDDKEDHEAQILKFLNVVETHSKHNKKYNCMNIFCAHEYQLPNEIVLGIHNPLFKEFDQVVLVVLVAQDGVATVVGIEDYKNYKHKRLLKHLVLHLAFKD